MTLASTTSSFVCNTVEALHGQRDPEADMLNNGPGPRLRKCDDWDKETPLLCDGNELRLPPFNCFDKHSGTAFHFSSSRNAIVNCYFLRPISIFRRLGSDQMAQNIRPPIPPGLIGPRQHPVLPPVNPGVTNGGWVVLPIPGATPAAQPAPLRPTIPHAWLNTEPHWMHRVGKGFVGKRILGRGGFGIVGHWSYEGPDRDQQVLKDVVVKQGLVWRPDWQWGMHFEADMLRQLNKANSSHVLRMYHDLYEEPGFNTDGFDRGLVHRLFLEYCPGGDLDGWSKSHAAALVRPISIIDVGLPVQ